MSPIGTTETTQDDPDLTTGSLIGARKGHSVRGLIRASSSRRARLCFLNQTLIRVIRGDYLFLLLLAEFLKMRIGAQSVPHRIEPEKCWGHGYWSIKPANVWRL